MFLKIVSRTPFPTRLALFAINSNSLAVFGSVSNLVMVSPFLTLSLSLIFLQFYFFYSYSSLFALYAYVNSPLYFMTVLSFLEWKHSERNSSITPPQKPEVLQDRMIIGMVRFSNLSFCRHLDLYVCIRVIGFSSNRSCLQQTLAFPVMMGVAMKVKKALLYINSTRWAASYKSSLRNARTRSKRSLCPELRIFHCGSITTLVNPSDS